MSVLTSFDKYFAKQIRTFVRMVRVAVIGAGADGLSTAHSIKLKYPSVPLTIISDRFLEATTSDGAGGLFRPDQRFVVGVDPNLLQFD